MSGDLTIISWNTALGAGDISSLVRELRQAIRPNAPLVLLLQEAYRGGPEVPSALDRAALFAGRLGGRAPNGARDEIEAVALNLGLSAYYVPSMRNGGPARSDEDRGNAILTNLPLSDFAAIELPFERQRRVAVAATVTGQRGDGTPWALRVVSAHLDNMVGLRRMWLAGGEAARARQARGLVDVLRNGSPLVIGGDFNTWFGFNDRGYIETAAAFPQTKVTDRRATFRGVMRLDHLFYRLDTGWQAQFRRGDNRHGSDHSPLIATIKIE